MASGRIITFEGITPTLGDGAFVAPGAVVIGDVHLGADASVWYNTVIRGDVHEIRIGARTNIQDGCVVHISEGTHPTYIGDEVTVGHKATIHGCTIADRCLIGMGAIVLDGATIEEGALVGAGAVVTPGTTIPARTLAIGTPAKPVRSLTDDEWDMIVERAQHYVDLAKRHAG